MGERPIHFINVNVTIDTMLNFDVQIDVDGQTNVLCEHGIRLHKGIHAWQTDRQTYTTLCSTVKSAQV